MRFFNAVFFVVFVVLAPAAYSLASTPAFVVASVHPISLMARSVVDESHLYTLVKAGQSPHTFSLKPSDLVQLQKADIIIWAGARVEPYLAQFRRRWPDKQWLDLSDFEHLATVNNPHLWLSVDIMTAAQAKLATLLGRSPELFRQQMLDAQTEIKQQLEPVKYRGFYVLHPAFDHFVHTFGLKQIDMLTHSPEFKPGLRTTGNLKASLKDGRGVCIFKEPQFPSLWMNSLVRGLPIRVGELDPLGADIPLSSDGYARFLFGLSAKMYACLTPN